MLRASGTDLPSPDTKRWTTYKRWRELFAIHPAAEKMPRPTAEEFELLNADIAVNGLKIPVEFLIVGDQDKACSWLVLDGIARLDVRSGWKAVVPFPRFGVAAARSESALGW